MTSHRLDCLAGCDIEEAAAFYESKRAGLGAAFRIAVAEPLNRILATPEFFPIIRSGIRRCLVRRFPYSVLYHYDGEIVDVLVVTDLRRKPDWWAARVGNRPGK
ncbi:MAG: type II toxin-antitoxin system RelE/ParE family toxin [Chthoniobacteraceae bacterium]